METEDTVEEKNWTPENKCLVEVKYVDIAAKQDILNPYTDLDGSDSC